MVIQLLPDGVFAVALGFLLVEIFAQGFAKGRVAFSLRWWRDFVGFSLIVFLSMAASRSWLAHRAVGRLVPLGAAAVIMTIFLAAPAANLGGPNQGTMSPRAVDDCGDVEATLVIVLLIALSVVIFFGSATA